MKTRPLALLAFICYAVVVLADEDVDYYEVLGLDAKEESTEKDIKKQFRTLSKQYHPDQNPDETIREKYKLVQRAYEVLSDRKKRKVWDMKGEEGLKQLEQQKQQAGRGMDPFAAMFGGGGGGGVQKGQDARMTLAVPLRELYNGATHRLTITKQKICKKCKGTGAHSKQDFKKCSQCGGKGQVIQRVQLMPGFEQQVQAVCPKCNGSGRMVKKKCAVCKGNRVVRGEHHLEVEIEQGMPDEHQIVFEMEADQSPEVLPGDVIFVINTKNDDTFTRKGNDLEATMQISLKDALLGFQTQLTHMDNRRIPISRTSVTPYGHRMRIKGEGMPKHNVPSEKGDLYVTFEILFPKKLSDDAKAKVSKALGYEPPAKEVVDEDAEEGSEDHEEM